jgi:hypothetical protein
MSAGASKATTRSGSKERAATTAVFTQIELEAIVKKASDSAVQVATAAFEEKLKTLRSELELQRCRTKALEAELDTARNAHQALLVDHNRLEQYSRRAHLRISGLELSEGQDCKTAVAEFLSGKLRTRENKRMCITRADLDAAHILPVRPLSQEERAKSKEERTPMIICCFFSRELRDNVILCRRSLKSSGCSIQEDLTVRNFRLLQSLKKCPKVESTWTWNGKVFAKEKGARKGKVYDLFDPLPL